MDSRLVIPNNILVLLSIKNNVVVLCGPLIRTVSGRCAGAEDGGIDGTKGQVVADSEAGLVEVVREGGLCDGLAGDADLDGAGGGEDVDALEGVFGVAVDGEVFFEPGVFLTDINISK